MKINVEATVAAPIEKVWRAYTTSEDITQWNAASDDWHTTSATVDQREGGACYDNAMAESFFATLECELLDRSRFQTFGEARRAAFAFIEGFYNPRRRHSSLGYVSPAECERRFADQTSADHPDTHNPAPVFDEEPDDFDSEVDSY